MWQSGPQGYPTFRNRYPPRRLDQARSKNGWRFVCRRLPSVTLLNCHSRVGSKSARTHRCIKGNSDLQSGAWEMGWAITLRCASNDGQSRKTTIRHSRRGHYPHQPIRNAVLFIAKQYVVANWVSNGLIVGWLNVSRDCAWLDFKCKRRCKLAFLYLSIRENA